MAEGLRSVRNHIRTLHSFAPPSRDHVSALRFGTGVAVPAVTVLMFGRPELTIYALFGGLAGMYVRTEPHQLRLKHQLQAAVMLVTGVMVGAGLSVKRNPQRIKSFRTQRTSAGKGCRHGVIHIGNTSCYPARRAGKPLCPHRRTRCRNPDRCDRGDRRPNIRRTRRL